MGILNITPDSFSDGGQLWQSGGLLVDALLARAEEMVTAGAAILDVGGESTRPGAQSPSEAEELDRVIPAIEWITGRLDVCVSIDTSSPAVMQAAVEAGAHMINDVRALERPGALERVADLAVPVCLMHRQGEPQTMQLAPTYDDVVAEVSAYLLKRVEAARLAGIAPERIVLDPGFGFGKSLPHNLALIQRLPELASLPHPLMVGLSRKSMIGEITGRPTQDRLAGSVLLAALAAQRGARILRVHDVAETVDALKIMDAVGADG
jgi:dihydropteroate synthase